MSPLGAVLADAEATENGIIARVPESWKQGRTAYGGFSSALALHAALGSEPNLPPLRSAQVSFIGPLDGDLRVTASTLRRGRNAAFVQADVASDKGLGLRATFVFMGAVASALSHDQPAMASIAAPPAETTPYIGPENFFTGNFEFVDHKDGLGPAEWLRWARLRDRTGLHPAVELLAIGDALPPAAFKLLTQMVPVSSLTWTLNLLTPQLETQDGWYLLRTRTDRVSGGYSSQRMQVWNAAGEPVADAMQAVAIFG